MEWKCRDKNCGKGEININCPVMLRIGCNSRDMAYPCSVCGRLHWVPANRIKNFAEPVCNRAGQKSYFVDGVLAFRD